MASYQEMEVKINVLSDMMNFLMSNLQMQGFRPNGLLKSDGSPDGEVLRGSAGEFYTLVKRDHLETVPYEGEK